jgi:hypothetical protein
MKEKRNKEKLNEVGKYEKDFGTIETNFQNE